MDENRTLTNKTVDQAGIRDPVLGGTLLSIDVFIVILNSLAVMVIMRFRTKNCIDILVLGLAMTDLTKGLIPVPMSVATYLTSWYMRPKTIACDFFGWIAFTTNSASMLILTMMAIERFVAIVKPFSYRTLITKRRLEISVLIAVLFSCFISALPFLGLGRMTSFNRGAYCHFDYTYRTSGSDIYAYFILVYGCAMTFVVLGAYLIVFYKIRDLIKRHKRFAISRSISSRSRSKRKRTEKGEINLKVEKMFSYLTLGLLLLFWISWFPFLAVLLLNLIRALPSSHDKVDLFAMRTAVVNSMLNPIACASFCKPYRRGFVYYYKKLLSYAGFARPDSDVFDPWRQKSREYTRENTREHTRDHGLDSSFVQADSNRAHPVSDVISDPEVKDGHKESVNESFCYWQQSVVDVDNCSESNEMDQLVSCEEYSQWNGVDHLLLKTDKSSENPENEKNAGYRVHESNVIQWKQNRVSQELEEEGMINERQRCLEQGEILIHDASKRPYSKRKPGSRVKRYSMPATWLNPDRNARPLSLEAITRKHGKYRPWSMDGNERVRKLLRENAFESNVQLVGYNDLQVKKADSVKNNPSEGVILGNEKIDQSKKYCDSGKIFENGEEDDHTNDDICKLRVMKQNRSLLTKDAEALKIVNQKDREQKRKSLPKFRSKSNPTSCGYTRKERSVTFSSLRDDLNNSLLEMDLLAKGLLRFSKSKVTP